jgi:hypothetical protein
MTLDRRHSSCSFSEVQFFSFICWQMDEDSNTMAMEIQVLRKSINHKSEGRTFQRSVQWNANSVIALPI